MKKTILATLLAITTNVQAIEPASALSIISIASSIPGHIERFTGSRSTTGIGEYAFGPDMSENSACQKAEDRAKLDAIRNILGEDVIAHSSRQCTETTCKSEIDVWSLSDAHLRKYKIANKEITEHLGNRICKITIKAQVSNDRPFADIYINSRFALKDGDNLNLEINSTDVGRLNIFHIEGNKATMIFPNKFQKESLVQKSISIPTTEYAMTVKASKFDESLVFVLTKNDETFLPMYDLTELNSKLLSIPIKERKIVRRNLVIEQ